MLLPEETSFTIRPQHLIGNLFLLAPPKGCIAKDDFLMIYSLSKQYMIWSKSNILLYELVPEEKAILTYNVDSTVQLLDMYTGSILDSFNLQRYSWIQHIMCPLCYFSGTKIMLINARTGEIVCMLRLDPVVKSLIHSVLLPNTNPHIDLDELFIPGIKYGVVGIPGTTCIEYINMNSDSGFIFEYA
jgi:hypothetical protein